MKKNFAICLLLLLSLITSLAVAQWPDRPIRLIVPFPPGGPSDLVGREVANMMRDELKQAVVVENRPGANGVIGHGVLAKAAGDGYTFGLLVITVAIAPHLGNAPFDTFKDFIPITNVVSMTPVIVANKNLPVHSLKELVEYGKSHPDKLAYGTPGIATVPHLAAELFQSQSHMQMLHVPFKGATQQIQDLIGGATQVDFQSSLVVALPQIKAGNVNAIAVLSSKRSSQLPQVPTASESGYPHMVVAPLFGLGAPAGVPKAIIDKVYRALAKGLQSKEVQSRFENIGATVQVSKSPADFSFYIKSEYDRWGKVIKEANIQASE